MSQGFPGLTLSAAISLWTTNGLSSSIDLKVPDGDDKRLALSRRPLFCARRSHALEPRGPSVNRLPGAPPACRKVPASPPVKLGAVAKCTV